MNTAAATNTASKNANTMRTARRTNTAVAITGTKADIPAAAKSAAEF